MSKLAKVIAKVKDKNGNIRMLESCSYEYGTPLSQEEMTNKLVLLQGENFIYGPLETFHFLVKDSEGNYTLNE